MINVDSCNAIAIFWEEAKEINYIGYFHVFDLPEEKRKAYFRF